MITFVFKNISHWWTILMALCCLDHVSRRKQPFWSHWSHICTSEDGTKSSQPSRNFYLIEIHWNIRVVCNSEVFLLRWQRSYCTWSFYHQERSQCLLRLFRFLRYHSPLLGVLVLPIYQVNGCYGVMLLYTEKICHLYYFNITLIDQ